MAFKGGKRPKAKLKYDRNIYTPAGARTLTEKELRKEYSRLRSIARKRLERFEGTEWTDTQVYLEYKEGFPTLKEITSDRDLRHLFSDVARFVTLQRGTVSGLEKERRTAVATLQDRGYDFVNKENFREFAEFMEYARASSMGRLYDSERVAEIYEIAEKKDYTNEQLRDAFKSYRRKQRKLAKVQNRKKKDANQFRKALE